MPTTTNDDAIIKPAPVRCPSQAATPEAPMPLSVTLASPYGFYDDADVPLFWAAGQVVTESADVALLVARGAPLVRGD